MASIVQSTIEARVERVQAKLRESDVEAKPSDVILRNLHEYLLIKEYRGRKLKKAQDTIQSSLSTVGFGPLPVFPPGGQFPPGVPATAAPEANDMPFPPHRSEKKAPQ